MGGARDLDLLDARIHIVNWRNLRRVDAVVLVLVIGLVLWFVT